MFCHYWYYPNKNFSMVHLLVMAVMIQYKGQQILKILLLFTLKKCRVYFKDISKHKAKKLMNKFNLVGKTGDIYCND